MKIGGKELVLTVFTNLDCPPTQVACSRHSWLAEYSNDSDDSPTVTEEKEKLTPQIENIRIP